MQNLPKVEGITPEVLWITLAGILALLAVFLLVEKVVDAIWKWRKRRKEESGEVVEGPIGDIRARLVKIESDVQGIQNTLDSVTEKLKNDNRRISALESGQQDSREGFAVLAASNLAILDVLEKMVTMDPETKTQLATAKQELIKYLTKA